MACLSGQSQGPAGFTGIKWTSQLENVCVRTLDVFPWRWMPEANQHSLLDLSSWPPSPPSPPHPPLLSLLPPLHSSPLLPPLSPPLQRLDFSGMEPDVKPFEERFGRRIAVSCHDLTFSLQGCVNEREDGVLTNIRSQTHTLLLQRRSPLQLDTPPERGTFVCYMNYA